MDNQTPPIPESQSSIPEVPTPVVTPPELPTKPYGRNWKKLIAIYLIIGAIIYGGVYYFVLSKQSSKPYSTSITKTQISPSPTTNSDPTTNWKTYKINSLELEYKLPPKLSKFGEQKEEIRKGAEGGTAIGITFSNSTLFAFGARSKDFQEGREYGFLDSLGYEKNIEIPANLVEEITNANGIRIYKIKGKNDPNRGTPLRFNPGEGRIGALINIPSNAIYPGFAVEMTITSELTVKDFDQILQTFKFTK